MPNKYIQVLIYLFVKDTQIKTPMGSFYTPTRKGKMKKTDDIKCWERCGAIRTLLHYGWECTVWKYLLKLNIDSLYDPTYSYLSKATHSYSHQKSSIRMFTAALFIMGLNWQQSTCLSAGDCINQLCSIHTTERYTAMRAMDHTICNTKNLPNIMLNEKSLTLKSTYCMLYLYKNQRWAKAISAVRCQDSNYF